MTRYFINIEQAINLCIFSIREMLGGEVFFPKMKSFNVINLAKAISKNNNPDIIFTKPGLGEKLYEELVTENEILRTVSFRSYYVVVPEMNENSPNFFRKIKKKYMNLKKIKEPSRSNEKLLSFRRIKDLLKKSKLL